jgi:peroxiredoxin
LNQNFTFLGNHWYYYPPFRGSSYYGITSFKAAAQRDLKKHITKQKGKTQPYANQMMIMIIPLVTTHFCALSSQEHETKTNKKKKNRAH